MRQWVVLCVLLGGLGCGPRGPRSGNGPRAQPPLQMVASAHPLATRAGLEVLRQGGNAMDAAAVTALVLGVVEPHHSGLGGGGFALVYDARKKRVATLDFRERAPLRATADMYLKPGLGTRPSQVGHVAVGTPGLVAGVAALARRHGRWTWKRLLEPARRLAAAGFRVDPYLRQMITTRRQKLSRFPASRAIFLPGGRVPTVGQRLIQTDLARTLTRLQTHGAREFYTGETARLIVAEMRRGNGLLGKRDLEQYRARWAAPVRGHYRGFDIYGMGSPSSGGTHVIQMLHILEGFPLNRLKPSSPRRLHLVAEAMRLAFADRAKYQGDARFVKVPTRGLLSRAYAAALRRKIDERRARPVGGITAGAPQRFEAPNTTHLCVIDRLGNTVSLTSTINRKFGSGVVVPGTGIVLNDQMDDFTTRPGRPNSFGLIQSRQNAIQPGKSPLSSMSPTLVFRGGRLRGVLGSPGGPRIITTVLQILLNLIDHRMSARQAVTYPRIHHQWRPAVLLVERPAPSAGIVAQLRTVGHRVSQRGPWANAMLLWIDEHGRLAGVADPRRTGLAAGF